MSLEDFTIVGGRYLECPVEGCAWEATIGCREAGDDLGSLLDAARDHLTTHETCQPGELVAELKANEVVASGHVRVVYYMRTANLVKIGTTIKIGERLGTIGAEGVMAIELGGFRVERERHTQFGHLRTHGEWFKLADDLGAHIGDVRERFHESMGVTTEEWLADRLPRRRTYGPRPTA